MEDANWLLNKLIFIAMQMLLSTSMAIFTCFCVACFEWFILLSRLEIHTK